MIQNSKVGDERREAGAVECWCLHGAVGTTADWRTFSSEMAGLMAGTRAVDLWRFLECEPMPIADFGKALNADAGGQALRVGKRALLGYSMGGRLALHALLEENHPWHAAVVIGAHPGLAEPAEREARAAEDAAWAARALTSDWVGFLDAWDAQPVLQGAPDRDPQSTNRLKLRRREIARSFVDWSLGAQQPLWDRLPEITIPVLWVVGGRDAKFLELAERATSRMPNATLAVAPDTGHRVPQEAPQWLAREVSRFLQTGS